MMTRFRHMLPAVLFLCVPMLSGAQVKYLEFMDAAPKAFPIRTVHCDAVERPPVIDGEMDDAVWASADVLSDFAVTDYVKQGEPATRRTEVRFLHDDRNLYVAFVCHEPDTAKMRQATARFDCPDILYDDRIELLIDARHDHANLVRLVVNPLGVMYDTNLCRPVQYALSYQTGDDNWNTEWRAKVRRHADRWCGEIAIALDRFSEEGIAPGDTWGINVVRDSRADLGDGARFERLSPERELSALVPVRSRVMGRISDRYIEPILYADLLFDQRRLEVSELRFNEAYANYNGSIWQKPQFYGENPLFIRAKNLSSAPLDLLCTVSATDSEGRILRRESRFAIAPGLQAEHAARIPVRRAGRLPFEVELTDAATGERLYRTSYATRVPAFVEFDLAAAYAVDTTRKTDAVIAVAPVAVPGTMRGCVLDLTLRDGAGREIASERLSGLEEFVFVPCFAGVDWTSMAGGDYAIDCRLTDASGRVAATHVQRFTRSVPTPAGALSAAWAPYSFGGRSGNSVTVRFPAGERFVFWEHASYIPWWDLAGMGVTYEFMECWGYGNQGCNEPMQDKENRYSRPRIVENSPARVVVEWRYAFSDANYRILFKEWVNEYYYLYPDGSGVREVRLWANSNVNHEVLQPQYVFPSGVVPRQMFTDTAAELFNLAGERIVNRPDAPILKNPESTGTWSEEIMRIHLRDRKHPYLVWSKQNGLFDDPVNNALIKGDVCRSLGGHWPMRQLNVDVYSIVDTSEPYHSWLGALQARVSAERIPNRWAHLIGLADFSNDRLRTIADNWLNPPALRVGGGTFEGYDAVQKAYLLRPARGAHRCVVQLSGAGEQGVVNPVFILKGAASGAAEVCVNGRPVPRGEYEAAPVEHDYEAATLVWLGRTVQEGDRVEITIQ